MTDTPAQPSRRRSPWWIIALAIIGALALVVAVGAAGWAAIAFLRDRSSSEQAAESQAAFYSAPPVVPATPGSIIRSEPLEYSVVGGHGFRIVYTSVDSAGKPIAVSGRIFLPTTPAPSSGRKVLAWAHGTVGLGTACAPSRATTYAPVGWLEPALQRGWVVVATDYAGLGMPGAPSYLIGAQEARDVVTSVQAARSFPDSRAGTDWVVYGSSQGGHSALWTAHEAARLAPGLHLVGVGAAVPAAELAAIMQAQWASVIGWVIGPDAFLSWQAAHPQRDFAAAVSDVGRSKAPQLIDKCVLEGAVTAEVLDRTAGTFFRSDPLADAAWSQTIREETPVPPTVPMFLAQGMADTVVLAGSTALLQNQWCAAGVTIASLWLSGVNHQNTSIVAGPAFVDWATDRFAGLPAPTTCSQGVPAPVVPLSTP